MARFPWAAHLPLVVPLEPVEPQRAEQLAIPPGLRPIPELARRLVWQQPLRPSGQSARSRQ